MSYFVVTLRLKERCRGFGEVKKMEGKRKAERKGFAPAAHICAYHIWKPKGVSWGCTCSPAPAHQLNWEKALFDCGEGGVDCPAGTQPDSPIDRGLLGWIERRGMALICRTSGESVVSGLRAAVRRVTLHFRRLCQHARLRACCQTEFQKTGGPECQTRID